MLIKRGIAVSPGVAIGPAMVLGAENFRIPHRFVSASAVNSELMRFQSALDAVCEEISVNERLAREQFGDQVSAIFSAHLMLVRDPQLVEQVRHRVQKQQSPEYAVSQVLGLYAKRLQNMGGHYLADRS